MSLNQSMIETFECIDKREASFDTAVMHFDRDYLWHPYDASRSSVPVYPVVAAEGCMIELADGRKLVDGMAS